MLKTKCIKADRDNADGRRISIMSRHTLADGVTPDPEITDDLYDEWWQELGPPPALIGAYYRRGMKWSDFESGYRAHLAQPEVAARLGRVAILSLREDITLLCLEPEPDYCHRRLVAEACQSLIQELEVDIR